MAISAGRLMICLGVGRTEHPGWLRGETSERRSSEIIAELTLSAEWVPAPS